MFSALIKTTIILIIVLIGALLAVFHQAYQGITLDAEKIIYYKPELSSEIFDKDGNRLAYIFKDQHRLYATYDEMPSFLVEGLIAMEDTRFFEHNGVNPNAILRAIFKDIQAGAFVEGGSTLTQQLIKNMILSREKKIMRKVQEAILAMKIEEMISKEKIIELYLNEISYGNNYYGIKTAAYGYFHKELNKLTLKESAMLVGIPNAPSFYNPIKHYNRVLDRANSVLFRMKSIGWITQEMYVKAIKESPKVYIHTSLTQNKAPYITDEVLRRFKGELGDIRTGGYKIYTTVDMNLQDIATKAVQYAHKNAIKQFGKKNGNALNGAFVAVESKTGNILAMVGGINYDQSTYNRATQSIRQPGSAFKPFIYQTALDMGYNPATIVNDEKKIFDYIDANGRKKVWAPQNFEKDFLGKIPLREALVHSRNLATINLVVDLGVDTIRERLKFLDVPHIPRNMSIALGNLGLSPLKMAQIYSVFANNGHMIEPRLVSKVISPDGAIIFETRPKEIANFTTPQQAFLMTDILKDVIKRGTGTNAQVDEIELAGKTGTTNQSVDAWFCGYSPTIIAVMWSGRDDNKPIAKRNATGGAVSAPAFSYFFRELLKIEPNIKRNFDIPQGVMSGKYKGKKEFYTTDSPLPSEKKKKRKFVNFNDKKETPSATETTNEDVEVIDYNPPQGVEDEIKDDMQGVLSQEDRALLEENGETITVNISGDADTPIEQSDTPPTAQEKEERALHPEKIMLKKTISEDSGALF